MTQIFERVRVIELAQYVFVPGASVLLADHGAEVIKIETPGAGDPYRTLKVGDGREVGAINLAMEQNNRNKKSVALDLKTEEGREALLKLIETADVFITSLRPKALRALRVDVADLHARNPRLIYARGNGYGFRGAEADKAGFDASTFWARSGLSDALSPPGAKLVQPRAAFGDHSGSVALAFAIAGALYKRTFTGEGSVVETSLLQTAVWALCSDITYSQAPGYSVHPTGGNKFPLMQSYATRDDRRILLMLLDPRPHWGPFCRLVGLDHLIDDPLYATNADRMKNAEALVGIIAERIATRTWVEWQEGFEAWDAPWELIRAIPDVPNDPQVRANDMLFDMTLGDRTIRLVAGPVAFDGRSVTTEPCAAPGMGEHTAALLAEVGYTPDEIEQFRSRKIAQ